MSDPSGTGGEPDLQTKVDFLKRPESYPEQVRSVEAVETHMSWVFLAGEHAWKLKKPVQNPYLDFTTLEKRRSNCVVEVEQNQRLAPDVYLSPVPLTVGENGRLQLGGEGRPVDWLVKMQRLPRERSLDYRIANGSLTESDLRPFAELLAQFYFEAASLDLEADEYREILRAAIHDNERQLTEDSYQLARRDVLRLTRAQLSFLDEGAYLLNERAAEGKIIEAHGDLRPEHIWLLETPVVIDCLEFNRDLRILDPASELAFLGLECERLHAEWIRDYVLSIYSEVTGDEPVPQLLEFYRRWHACTRAKLAAWHLKDHGAIDAEKWTSKANRYLHLAAAPCYAPPATLGPQDALIIVDVQNDFCPGGSLAVKTCRAMIAVLNRWITAAEEGGACIIASRDWHPPNHVSFQERGGPWPPHCVQDTDGASFCEDLKLPPAVEVVSKGTDPDEDSYSDFEGTGLSGRLTGRGIRRIWIGGLVLDVCVRATALDAVKAGFETYLIHDGTEPIDEAAVAKTLKELKDAGVTIV